MSSPQKPSPQPWNFIGCSGASQIPENFIERGTNPSPTSLSLVPPFANSPPQSRRRRILSGGGDQRRAGQISKRRMMRGRPCLCGFCQSPCHIYFRYTSRQGIWHSKTYGVQSALQIQNRPEFWIALWIALRIGVKTPHSNPK